VGPDITLSIICSTLTRIRQVACSNSSSLSVLGTQILELKALIEKLSANTKAIQELPESPSASSLSHNPVELLQGVAQKTIEHALSVRKSEDMSRSRASSVRANTSVSRRVPDVNMEASSSNSMRRVPVSHGGSTSQDRRKIIAICGMTGSGKSNFISKLTGHDVGIGHGLCSSKSAVTKEQEKKLT
jgi:ATPase subunit of ABC transporter with duplicated ATPase domains